MKPAAACFLGTNGNALDDTGDNGLDRIGKGKRNFAADFGLQSYGGIRAALSTGCQAAAWLD